MRHHVIYQSTVTEWLRTLEMEEYTKVFHMAGYKTASDVENLKEIDEREFRRMGITKIGKKIYWCVCSILLYYCCM